MDSPIRESVVDRIPVVHYSGSLDVYTAPQVKEVLVGYVNVGHSKIIVDLLECEYFDSTALGVLIGILKRARDLDETAILAVVTPAESSKNNVRNIFKITGLDKFFGMADSVDKAVDLIRNGPVPSPIS